MRFATVLLLSLVLFVFVSVSACSPRLKHKWNALRDEAARESRRLADDLESANNDADLGLINRLQLPPVDPELEDVNLVEDDEDVFTPLLKHRLQQRAEEKAIPPALAAKLASGDFDPSTFNPTPYEVNSPEWNMAMINFLLSMKNKGHKINEVETNKSLADLHRELSGKQASNPLVCKTAPYNECYRLDQHGQLHPIGDRRPVRILRVYKRNNNNN